MDKKIKFITSTGHQHCFDRKPSGKWFWSCFSTPLRYSCGELVKILDHPDFGKSLQFIISVESNTPGESRLFMVTTTTVVDIFR